MGQLTAGAIPGVTCGEQGFLYTGRALCSGIVGKCILQPFVDNIAEGLEQLLWTGALTDPANRVNGQPALRAVSCTVHCRRSAAPLSSWFSATESNGCNRRFHKAMPNKVISWAPWLWGERAR